MENVVFTQLTIPEIRQIFQQELNKYFSSQSLSTANQKDEDRWLDIDELRDYLPGKPARSTIYANISNIPHKKTGKRLAFLKSEIDAWLMSQGRKTISDIEKEAEEAITK